MAHDMYLTFDEYKGLGGTVDAAAWPPLECACRKRIDRLTDSRVQNMAEIPRAVKLCVFALAQMESVVGAVAQVTSPTVTSFNTDGYTENHGNVPDADAAAKQMNAIAVDMLYGELDDYGVPLLYRGVR